MKKDIIKIVISAILFVIALVCKFENEIINDIIFLISYAVIGIEIIWKAVKNIFHGELFDENFLMTVATIGAIVIGEYPEAVAVILFYEIGELMQDRAVDKSRESIESLVELRADYANLKKGEEILKVEPNEVKVGDIIIIKPGEKIPLDGEIIEGTSSIDTSALTGESVPRSVKIGDIALSGCINMNGVLTVKVKKKFGESTVSKILELIENTDIKKSKSEKFITKFAKFYTPIVVILALIIAIVPPLVLKADFIEWINRAFTFLVISCPCALVVSIPLGFFGGIGAVSKKGILIKGSTHIEDLAKSETIVCDKTGTITKGVFEVNEIVIAGSQKDKITEEKILEFAAYAESNSNHPIAKSIISAYNKKIDNKLIENIEEISGLGIKANIKQNEIIIGNSKIMKEFNIKYQEVNEIGTIVHIAINNDYCGYILISDVIKEDVKDTIIQLKNNKIKQIVMLTGDTESVASNVANNVGIDKYYAELLPNDKVDRLKELELDKSEKGKLVFVGDGINDAPVLKYADVGVAMGGLGSDAAIEVADVVIMTDEFSKIVDAIKISRKTLKIIKQNIIFAIVIKVLVLVLGAIGITNMWEAVFADVGVTIIAIINSLRILKVSCK